MKIMTGVLMVAMVATGHAAQPKKTTTVIVIPAHYHSADLVDRRFDRYTHVLDVVEGIVQGLRWEYRTGKQQRDPASTSFYNPSNDAAKKGL